VWYEIDTCTFNLRILEAVCSSYCISLMMVFPAFIIAQSRNGAMITLYPSALSSSVGLSYFISGGVVVILMFVSSEILNLQESLPDGCAGGVTEVMQVLHEVGFLALFFSSAWISTAQIETQFYGAFRTQLGRELCWFWTVSAILQLLIILFIICVCITNAACKLQKVWSNSKLWAKEPRQSVSLTQVPNNAKAVDIQKQALVEDYDTE